MSVERTRQSDRSRSSSASKRMRSDKGSVDGTGEEYKLLREEIREMKEVLMEMVNGVSKTVESLVSRMDRYEERFEKLDKDLKEQGEVVKTVADIVESLTDKMEENKKVISDLKVDVRKEIEAKTKDLGSRLDRLEKKTDLSEDIKALRWKAIDSEARSRRNNLLFYGIKEERDEDCSATIIKFMKDKLNLSEPVVLQRAHRTSKRIPNNTVGQSTLKPRPIIVCFLDFRTKEIVRSKRHNLRAPYGISEDLPLAVRKAQKSLLPQLKEIRKTVDRATIIYPAKIVSPGKVHANLDVTKFFTA